MYISKFCKIGIIFFFLIFLIIYNGDAATRNGKIQKDVMDASGAIATAASFNVVMGEGQSTPTGLSQRTNFAHSTVLLSASPFVPTGVIIAKIICPANFAQGCSITSQIKMDMTGMSPPDSLLAAFTGSIRWDPALLQFTQQSGILSGFTGVVNTTNASNGIITFNGVHVLGMGGVIDILNLDFDIIGPVGSNGILDLDFSDLRGIYFQVLLPYATINDCPFTIVRSHLLGDVSGEDLVNSTDALIILSFDAGLQIPPEFQDRINAGLGDVNSDGITNSTDAHIYQGKN